MRVTSPSPISPIIAGYLENLSPAHVTRRLNFYDDFNRTAEDTDVWTSGGDDGSMYPMIDLAGPTAWTMVTGLVIDNDRYIHGGANKLNKRYSINEDGYDTVTWKATLGLRTWFADVSLFLGLINTVIVDYAEPTRAAHFFADAAVSANFLARSHEAAEEETDTGVAVDAAMHDFKIVWTAASVLFYIDDVLVATHAAQVPTRAMVSEILLRTEAASARYLVMDRVAVEVS